MRRSLWFIVLLAAAGVLALGVTLAESALPAGDPKAGAKVFSTAGCGACHTLAAAKATGKVGPNLDRLKPVAARVARQVRTGGGGMPPFTGILTAPEIRHLAAYVDAATRKKSVVRPAPQPQDGRSLFLASCSACHTLAAAGSKGTRGPNLDDESPSFDKVVEQVREGDPPAMPSFAKTLTATQIERIATFVSSTTRD
jgi:cytochrome c6